MLVDIGFVKQKVYTMVKRKVRQTCAAYLAFLLS